MIVTAALIWYDESPEDLVRCIRGMATIVDRVVAIDGAYRRYPDAKPASPPEQAEAIRLTAAEVGLDCCVHVPESVWAGQIAKRSFALAEAGFASDWIAIFDTDWIATGDREAVRAFLAQVSADVVSVPFWTPPGDAVATGWHSREAGTWTWQPHLFRPLPGLHVERLHYCYAAMKDGRPVWMWGAGGGRQTLVPLRLSATYEIEHQTMLRDEQNTRRNRAYINDRIKVLARTGQEDHVPGLPEPEFDFETIPY